METSQITPDEIRQTVMFVGDQAFDVVLRFTSRGAYHDHHDGWEARTELNGEPIVSELGAPMQAMRSLAENIAYLMGSPKATSFMVELPIPFIAHSRFLSPR